MDSLLSREIRVFLSSTFRDMDAERNHLMQYVFPEIRRRCAERGAGFTEIDLRWGITEADAKNGRTVEICLAEIDRCRDYPPFFIGFLGERYGWIPLASDLENYWLQDADSPYRQAIEEALQQGISATELEIRFGVLNRMDMHKHAYFFLRSPKFTQELKIAAGDSNNDVFYDDGNGKLAILKQTLIDSARIDVQMYESLQVFGERIKQILLDQIDQRFPADEAKDGFAIQLRAHTLFAQSRRQTYVPLPSMREKLLAQIKSNMSGQYSRSILITGASGLGKSAFIADLAVWLPESMGAFVIDHYIGADGHRSIEAWRDRVLHRLNAFLPVASALPEDDLARWDILSLWLAQAKESMNMPIIILLDALDQLYDDGSALTRLGEAYWPTGVVLIASTILENTLNVPSWDIQTLSSPNREERCEMINVFTHAYRKSLDSHLLEKLLNSVPATTPLFLRIVLEDLRIRGKHETLDQRLNILLNKLDTAELFAFLLGEWDRDYGDLTHPYMASRLAAMLAASRQGLTEHELTELLAALSDPVSLESQHSRLPLARISLLLAVFQPYLLRNAGQDALMHSALVRGSLPANKEFETREFILDYFKGNGSRALAERVYQRLILLNGCTVEDAPLIRETIAKEFLQPRCVYLLFKEDNKLLQDALALLGASAYATTKEVEILIHAWDNTDIKWDDANSVITKWMLDMSFLSLSEAWSKGQLKYLQAQKLDDQDLAIGLKNLGNVYFATKRADEAIPLFEKALNIIAHAESPDIQEVARIQNNIANIYLGQKKFEEAILLHEQNLSIKRNAKHPNQPSIARTLNNLGAVYLKQKKQDKAKTLFEEALQIRRSSLPPSHPSIAESLDNLSRAYTLNGQHEAAIPFSLEALQILRHSLPPAHPRIAGCLLHTANRYQALGDLQKIEALYKDALDIYRSSLPPNHATTAEALHSLAGLYKTQGLLENAKALYLESLEIHRNCLPQSQSNIATNLGNLASVYTALKQQDNAETAYEEAISIYRQSSPINHTAISKCLFNIAMLFKNKNKLEQAEFSYNESLETHRNTFPANPTQVAECLTYLAKIYKAQKRLNDEESAHKEALSIRRQSLSANHPDIAQSLFNLAVICKNKNELKQAEMLYEESLEIYRNCLPKSQSNIATSLTNLASVYKAQKRLDDAETAHKEALSIRRQSLSANHPDIAQSLFNLALIYKDKNELKQAEMLYKESLEIYRNCLPQSQSNIATNLNNLAGVYKAQKRLHDAEVAYEEALSIRRQSLPANHPNIAQSLFNLALIYKQNNKFEEAELLYKESLEIYRTSIPSKPLSIADCLNNLGVLYKEQKRHNDAERIHKEALSIRQQSLPTNHISIAHSLSNLADTYLGTIRQDEAESLYQDSLQIRRSITPAKPLDTANCLYKLAELYQKQGRLVDAKSLITETLDMRKKALSPDDPDLIKTIEALKSIDAQISNLT